MIRASRRRGSSAPSVFRDLGANPIHKSCETHSRVYVPRANCESDVDDAPATRRRTRTTSCGEPAKTASGAGRANSCSRAPTGGRPPGLPSPPAGRCPTRPRQVINHLLRTTTRRFPFSSSPLTLRRIGARLSRATDVSLLLCRKDRRA
jgi:hypothetical protein